MEKTFKTLWWDERFDFSSQTEDEKAVLFVLRTAHLRKNGERSSLHVFLDIYGDEPISPIEFIHDEFDRGIVCFK